MGFNGKGIIKLELKGWNEKEDDFVMFIYLILEES